MHERVEEYTGQFELPVPDEDIRATLHRIVEREVAILAVR